MHKVELFQGLLRFSPICIIIDFILILHFIFSWKIEQKKSGWKIDYWYFNLGIYCFLTIFVMYPFNASILNIGVWPGAYAHFESYIDKAFLLSVLGYIFIWLGRVFFDFFNKSPLIESGEKVFNRFFCLIERNIRNKRIHYFLWSITFFFSAIIVVFELVNECLFKPRTYFLINSNLRPIFNFTNCLLPLTVLYSGLYYLKFKEKMFKKVLVFFLILSIFMGSRGVILNPVISLILFGIISNKGSINLMNLFSYGVLVVYFIFYLEGLRDGCLNPLLVIGKFGRSLFYGNNFSDTRDFAWVISYWDEELLLGKSWLAGLMSFIPRFMSEFRETWAIGVFTVRTLGMDPLVQHGIRPGLFGEAYFNFGCFGVCFLGLLLGYTLRFADKNIKRALSQDNNIIQAYAKTFLFTLACNFSISAGFWSIYFFIFINILLPYFAGIRFLVKPAKRSILE